MAGADARFGSEGAGLRISGVGHFETFVPAKILAQMRPFKSSGSLSPKEEVGGAESL